MPKKLKNIREYICKITTPLSFSTTILGCRHPRTNSFTVHRSLHQPDHHQDNHKNDEAAATLSDVDQFLLENFKSLYTENSDEDHTQQKKVEKEEDRDDYHYHHQVRSEIAGGILFESPRFIDPPPHLCGSQRFFVATGPSSSLIEEAWLSMTSNSEEGGSISTSTSKTATVNDSTTSSRSCNDDDDDTKKNVNDDDYIAVRTYSRSPYDDFRRSMQEMVEAKLEQDGGVDWDFMEELLICYLNLNEKKSRKFIINAFVDVTVGLRRRYLHSVIVQAPARQGMSSGGADTARIAGERRRKSRNVT